MSFHLWETWFLVGYLCLAGGLFPVSCKEGLLVGLRQGSGMALPLGSVNDHFTALTSGNVGWGEEN